MASNKREAKFKSIKLWLYQAMILTFFLLLTIVVIMLVTGALHILNQNFFNILHFDIITVMIAIIICLVSLGTFVKNYKKIRSSLKAIVYSSKKEPSLENNGTAN